MPRIKDPILKVSGAAICGMDLVTAGWIALGGTYDLAQENIDILRGELPDTIVDRIFGFKELLSDDTIAEIISSLDVAAFCEVEKRGIYRALWDIAEVSKAGVEVFIDRIPIRQETVEVCEILDVDPYSLYSGSCFLMACEEGEAAMEAFLDKGIEANVIGRVTEGRDRVIITGSTRRFLSPR